MPAKINYILLCEKVMISNENQRILVNPLQVIYVESLEQETDFMINLGFVGIIEQNEYTVNISLTDPSNKVSLLGSVTLGKNEITSQTEPSINTPINKVTQLSLEIGKFTFEEKGQHKITADFIDEQEEFKTSRTFEFVVSIKKNSDEEIES